ncbi:hypothetical protein BDP27DRAFT_1364912 [Rhodocollybia butyracea]|uniref:Uncharacterized protein n=1 Tax=Rhodocollybia butyracea TaxID=206335 RepID=A0A9P5PQ75_9AGAR|nr:hypothetical protein BDP27DRAFT_1364912 [Rhodocollybia butyracea]
MPLLVLVPAEVEALKLVLWIKFNVAEHLIVYTSFDQYLTVKSGLFKIQGVADLALVLSDAFMVFNICHKSLCQNKHCETRLYLRICWYLCGPTAAEQELPHLIWKLFKDRKDRRGLNGAGFHALWTIFEGICADTVALAGRPKEEVSSGRKQLLVVPGQLVEPEANRQDSAEHIQYNVISLL